MAEPSAEQVVKEIRALLDERVDMEGAESKTLYERVVDVVGAYESWSELAIRRLHEIHRLSGEECAFCPYWGPSDSDEGADLTPAG